MVLCYNCEKLQFPIVASGQSSEGSRLSANLQSLKKSAKNCDLCNLFLTALASIRTKGIKNGVIKLHTWASTAQGDPIGMSRVFVKVGDTTGRFIDVFAEQGSPAAEAGIAAGRVLPSNFPTDLNARFCLYREWLCHCIENHPRCLAGSTEYLPSRVVQVSSSDGSPLLKLAQTVGLTGQYAALSHCWGGYGGLRTYKSSLQDHMNSIEATLLSRTVADAVAITRGLGLQYLWVDTLCIVQDDTADWKAEAATMDLVYRNAVVTIAASSAKDGRGGCLLQSSSPTPVKVPLTVTTSKNTTSIMFKPHSGSIAEGFENSPLSERGWCLQEAILSRRILHFRQDRVIWQCKESLTAEDYANLRQDPDETTTVHRIHSFSKLPVTPSLNDWFNVVEDYSRRRLTVSRDKLYAMRGLSNFFRSSLGDIYLDGLWLTGIHSCLLWISATGEMQEPPSPRAPTWSWAALDGSVYHFETLRSLGVTCKPILQILRFANFELSSAVEQLGRSQSTEKDLVVCAPTRRIYRSDYTIPASGFNIAASESFQNLLYERRNMKCHKLLDSQGETCGWATLDQESFVLEDMHCLLVSTVTLNAMFQAHNVMILRDGNEENNFKFTRMGVGEITSESFFDGIPASSIAIE